MKKIPISIALLVGIVSVINAQDITFGVKGGINYITIGELFHKTSDGESGVVPTDNFVYSSNKEMGYNFGAYFRINLNQFYIQPEVTFVSLKSNYELGLATSYWTQSNVDIPLLFGYRVYHPVSVYAGPIFSMISDRQLEGVEEKAATPWSFEKSSVAIGVGVNAIFGRIMIDFRYSYGFTKVEEIKIDMVRAKYGTNIGYLLEYNPSQFIVNAQIDLFNFGGEKKKRGSKTNWRNHKNL